MKMFLHSVKYEIRAVLRAKDFIMWLMLFPVVLGTLFKVAFGSIYANEVLFNTIPVAIVEEKPSELMTMLVGHLTEDEGAMLSATKTDSATAEEMLFDGKVTGILTVGDEMQLTVTGRGMEQTILQEIVTRCGLYETVIRDAIPKGEEAVNAALEALSAEMDVCREKVATDGNADPYVGYFYNLIAMVAICGSVTGLHVATDYQPNQTPLGARKNCSATPKSRMLTAGIIGSCVAQSCCMILCVTFLRFVLRIRFGGSLPLLYLTAILSGFLGVTFGFFIGSLGRMKFEVKSAIAVACSMTLCFLSGLMMGDIKGRLALHAPIVNKLNPVALMSDSYYCLNMYSDYSRYLTKVAGIAAYIVLFTVLGVLITRRKKYASI